MNETNVPCEFQGDVAVRFHVQLREYAYVFNQITFQRAWFQFLSCLQFLSNHTFTWFIRWQQQKNNQQTLSLKTSFICCIPHITLSYAVCPLPLVTQSSQCALSSAKPAHWAVNSKQINVKSKTMPCLLSELTTDPSQKHLSVFKLILNKTSLDNDKQLRQLITCRCKIP